MIEPSPFVEHLRSLAKREDRAALAALRRGLGKPPGSVAAMFPYVTPFIPEADNRPGREDPWYLVGALFALHPEHTPEVDLGAMYRSLGDNPSTDLRFRALLQADSDQLAYHLRQAISLARSAKRRTGLDWHLLLYHLRQWEHPDRWVQRAWARSFWRAAAQPTTPESDTDSNPS